VERRIKHTLLMMLIVAGPAFAQDTNEDIDRKIEVETENFRKTLEEKYKPTSPKTEIQELLDWRTLSKKHPRVISLTLDNMDGFKLSGIYMGYVFSEYFEVGSLVSLKLDSATAKNDSTEILVQDTNSMAGIKLLGSLPLSQRFILYTGLIPCYLFELVRTTVHTGGTPSSDDGSNLGPAFRIEIPIGIGLRVLDSFELRTAVRYIYVKGNAIVYATEGTTTAKYRNHYADYAGALEFRYRY
jgi:hypothetical protein